MPDPTTSTRGPGPQVAAGVFALLFLISGAEGQETVQFGFLLLTGACLVLERHGAWLQRRLQAVAFRWRLQV